MHRRIAVAATTASTALLLAFFLAGRILLETIQRARKERRGPVAWSLSVLLADEVAPSMMTWHTPHTERARERVWQGYCRSWQSIRPVPSNTRERWEVGGREGETTHHTTPTEPHSKAPNHGPVGIRPLRRAPPPQSAGLCPTLGSHEVSPDSSRGHDEGPNMQDSGRTQPQVGGLFGLWCDPNRITTRCRRTQLPRVSRCSQ